MHFLNLVKGNLTESHDEVIITEEGETEGFTKMPGWKYKETEEKTIIVVEKNHTTREKLEEIFSWINSKNHKSVSIPYNFGDWKEIYPYLSLAPIEYECSINIFDETKPIEKEAVKTYSKREIVEKLEQKDAEFVLSGMRNWLKKNDEEFYIKVLKEQNLSDTTYPRITPFQKCDVTFDEYADLIKRIKVVYQIKPSKNPFVHLNARGISYELFEDSLKTLMDGKIDGYILVYLKNGMCITPFLDKWGEGVYVMKEPRMMTDEDILFFDKLDEEYGEKLMELERKKKMTSLICEKQRLRKIMKK